MSDVTFYDRINTIYQFIKPFWIIKCLFFKEYGAVISLLLYPRGFPAAVHHPGDEFVDEAIRRATSSVDNAISLTRDQLFDRGRTHTAGDMMSLFRYPTAESLELARAEEVFEQTLEIIHRHVAEGHHYNVTGSGRYHTNNRKYLSRECGEEGCQHNPVHCTFFLVDLFLNRF